jgi:hypothetical protein
MVLKYKPTGALKKLVDVGKKPTRVMGSVERHVISKPRDEARRTDVLHPSEMAGDDWCYRSSYFQLKGHKPINKRTMSLRLASVFEEGHQIHAKWQRWFQEMGTLYGKWYCQDCDEYFWGGADCHEGPLVYNEVPLFYEPLRISGHADGWLVNLGNPLMLEIKSIGIGTIRYEAKELIGIYNGDMDKMWGAIDAPFMKHIQQVQIYMKLAELIGLPDCPQEAVIIYENKATQDAKEFVIPKSDFAIAEKFAAAASIMEALDKNEAPLCNIKAGGCSKCGDYNE